MIGITWNGTDGSVWNLRTGPVRLTTAGVKGLGSGNLADQTSETALQDGQRLNGWRLKEREVWLPLHFKDAGAVDVEGVQRAFWQSMAPGQLGTLVVTDGDGATRQLGLRFQDDGGVAYSLDPSVLHEAVGVTLVADQPWWEGPALTTFYGLEDGTGQSFFGTGATPFYIGSAQGSGTRTLANPGDQPAWVTWTVSGPTAQVRLGVDGHYTGGAIVVGQGSVLTVETDPLRQLAWLNGVKVTRQLSEVDFAPVPKGATVPIYISVIGTGLVTATIKPKYMRAF